MVILIPPPTATHTHTTPPAVTHTPHPPSYPANKEGAGDKHQAPGLIMRNFMGGHQLCRMLGVTLSKVRKCRSDYEKVGDFLEVNGYFLSNEAEKAP